MSVVLSKLLSIYHHLGFPVAENNSEGLKICMTLQGLELDVVAERV